MRNWRYTYITDNFSLSTSFLYKKFCNELTQLNKRKYKKENKHHFNPFQRNK